MLLSAAQNYTQFFTDNYSEFATQSDRISDVSAGIYQLVLMIGGFGVVFAIGVTAIVLMAGGSKLKAEAKNRLIWVVGIGTLIFGLGALIQTIYNYAAGLTF